MGEGEGGKDGKGMRRDEKRGEKIRENWGGEERGGKIWFGGSKVSKRQGRRFYVVERGSRKQEEGMEKTNSGTGGEVKDDESEKKNGK